METFNDVIQRHMATVKGMGILEDDININIEDLQQISYNLGMTSEDWELVLKEAEKRLELAKDHFERKSFRNSILACEEAQLLNPFMNGVRGLKAKCFLLLAINEEDDSYLPKAEKQAQLTLSKEPKDKNALEVIATISSKTRVSKNNKALQSKSKLILSILGLITILGTFVGVFYFYEAGQSDDAKQKIELHEKQLESAFEKQLALIPKVKGFIDDSEEDSDYLDQLEAITNQLNKDLQLSEKYQLHVALGSLLSEIIYKKSIAQPDSQVLKDLRVLLEGIENRVKSERKYYNEAIIIYNAESMDKLDKL